MSWYRTGAAFALVACTLAGGAAFAASVAYSRPVMPSFIVEIAGGPAQQLMLVYGESGSDPVRSGALAPDQRISACRTSGTLCTSPAARDELRLVRVRAQSVQVRLATGRGNPIVGGVHWTGPAYPKQVRLKCDLRAADVRQACAVVDIQA